MIVSGDGAAHYVLTMRLPRPEDHPVEDEYAEALAAVLADGRAERVAGWIVRAGEAPPELPPEATAVDTAEVTTIEASAKRGRAARPGVSYRACNDENVHRRAIWRSRDLKVVPSGLVCATALNLAMGRHLRGDYGQPMDFAVQLIAEDAGVSVRTAGRAMEQVVRLGFFRRLDYGYGGRGDAKLARWAPIVPAWFKG